jgi:hypothetical protein
LNAEPQTTAPALRPAAAVMTPAGLSAYKACRFSFVRGFIRRICAERWRIKRPCFDLDAEGRGTAVYRVVTGERDLNFIIFSDVVPPHETSERIIAMRYDGVALVTQGPLDAAAIETARREEPKFILSRSGPQAIGWTRCNRGARSFPAIVEALAAGRQPAVALLAKTGYILRNNGFWGNGRHGTAVFPSFQPHHPLSTPYMAEIFTLYLWRHFGFDLVEHVARARNPGATRLDPRLKRYLGMGNASGLGMVPFIINHPHWIDAWIGVREAAIAAARAARPRPGDPEAARLLALVDRCIAFFGEEAGRDDGLFTPPARVVADLSAARGLIAEFAAAGTMAGRRPDHAWAALDDWAAAHLDRESLEQLHALLIEAYPGDADRLAKRLIVAAPRSDVAPEMSVGTLRGLLRRDYGWAFDLDLERPGAWHFFWYYSEENEEPRIGVRGIDPGEAFEPLVDIPFAVRALDRVLAGLPGGATVAELLIGDPGRRAIVERVQALQGHPYGEVRGNVVAADFQPCHVIRFALSLLGVEKFEPVSSKWVRGTFLQGAPLAADVAAGVEGDWLYPLRPAIDDAA